MGKSGTGHQCLFTTNGVGSTLSVVKCTLQVSKSVSDYCCRLLLVFFYLRWASCFASTKMTEWVNVAPNEQFSDVLGWEQVILVFLWDDEVRFVLDQQLSYTCIVLVHGDNSSQVDMSQHAAILSWFRINPSLFLLLIVAGLPEKQQIPII